MLSFFQFLKFGREQWRVQPNWARRVFVRLFGPLGVHAKIRNGRVVNAIVALDLPAKARALDAGCGHAYASFWLARRFPGWRIDAVENDHGLVAENREIAEDLHFRNLAFAGGEMSRFRATAPYNLIFSIDLLEHVPDDTGLLENFHRMLSPNGKLLLHLPRRHQEHRRIFPGFRRHTTPEHVRDEYTAPEISQKLRRSGFEVEYLRYGFSWRGELAFELNNLFWERPWLRVTLALLFHPLSIWLGYLDTRENYEDGNSLLILARKAT
ncbi:MAG: Trans-aconitate 2-methyltransferase [Chloroflexi bacterium]|nr:Trans-aconitate 2-methyltransferase [Chloroflexota bacterium]